MGISTGFLPKLPLHIDTGFTLSSPFHDVKAFRPSFDKEEDRGTSIETRGSDDAVSVDDRHSSFASIGSRNEREAATAGM